MTKRTPMPKPGPASPPPPSPPPPVSPPPPPVITGPKNPFTKPVIHDIANPADAALYGLSPDEARTLRSHSFGPRSMQDLWIVLHTQAGNTVSSLDWWVHGPNVQASANFMANQDGTLLRVIPSTEGPWTNGDVCNPTAESAALRAAGGNPNLHSLTIEAEGDWNVPYTPGQRGAILWLCAEWMLTYGIPLGDLLPHSSINQCSRANCPGAEHMRVIRGGLSAAGFE